MPKVVTLVAGPANRKAIAAPGETPARIKAAASGVLPLAQTYTGMPRSAKRRTSHSVTSVKLCGRKARQVPVAVASDE